MTAIAIRNDRGENQPTVQAETDYITQTAQLIASEIFTQVDHPSSPTQRQPPRQTPSERINNMIQQMDVEDALENLGNTVINNHSQTNLAQTKKPIIYSNCTINLTINNNYYNRPPNN